MQWSVFPRHLSAKKEQCKHGIRAIFGKPIIDSKFAHDRRRDVVESVTVPLDPSLLVTVPLGLRVCNWMYPEITQKFAKRITHIYFTDEIKCTGRAGEKRGSVTINWGALRCGFADENERSPFLAVLHEVKAVKIYSFYLAKKKNTWTAVSCSYHLKLF